MPPGFAHGFCALDKENFVVYSCTEYRDAKSEIGIKYNDLDLNIKWPINKPILSKKDKKITHLKILIIRLMDSKILVTGGDGRFAKILKNNNRKLNLIFVLKDN